MADDVREAMLTYPCEFCGAAPGEWCVTKSGGRPHFLHADRWWQWKRDDRDAEG